MWWLLLAAASGAATWFGYREMHRRHPEATKSVARRVLQVRNNQVVNPNPTTDADVNADIQRMQVLMRAASTRWAIFHQPDAIHNAGTVIPLMFFEGSPEDALRMFDQVAADVKPGAVMYIWDRTRSLDTPIAARVAPIK